MTRRAFVRHAGSRDQVSPTDGARRPRSNHRIHRCGLSRKVNHSGEAGLASSVEMVIVIPVLLLILATVIAMGRYWHAHVTTEHAAHSAVRAATLHRNHNAAQDAAVTVVESELNDEQVRCRSQQTLVNGAAFSSEPGDSANVTVTVTCVIGIEELGIPFLPGAFTVKHSATSVLDRYRGREE